MASIGDSGGGKRGLNPEVNLVPFIDLLSVCICFLLVSAVWLQVGSVQVKQTLGTVAPDNPPEMLDLTVTFVEPFAARFELQKKGNTVQSWDVRTSTQVDFIKAAGDQFDAHVAQLPQLAGQPLAAGAPPPAAKDVVGSATLVPVKNVPYRSLIMAMDVLRKREIVNLAVTPKAG